jgi:predicted naringenin-chalcone synthase
MSSAIILFILKELLDNRSATLCMILGFGPGLVAQAALLLWIGAGKVSDI